ncbi:hypothetical protein [Providencia sp. PROV197]|uniref:hypothetical protein n=1 Tax=Providencia sp. PROV197 TaxID=2949898 RepID=UPI00234ABB70|nr:hypothetical protein [Providencia sp. PROV197]
MDPRLIALRKNIALWGALAYAFITILPIVAKSPESVQKITTPLGTTIFIGLTISYFINKIISKETNYEVKELINNKFPNLISMEKIGLKKIEYNNNLNSLGIDIIASDDLCVVMNDGRNFLSVNAGDFAKRLTKENKKTVVILINPDSDAQSFLCKKNNKKTDYYKSKIESSITEIKSFAIKLPTTSTLTIYLIPTILSQNIILTESLALIGIYRNAPGKSNPPPQFIYENSSTDGEYKNIQNDINELKKIKDVETINVQPILDEEAISKN